jgi:hypothetical protein
MDIDDASTSTNNKNNNKNNNNKSQLPWVEKYRPNRWVFWERKSVRVPMINNGLCMILLVVIYS